MRWVDNFCDWLDKRCTLKNSKGGLHRVDLEFLVKVFAYGFNYYVWKIDEKPEKYKYGVDGIKFNWIVGKEALKRFDRNEVTYDKMSFDRNIAKAYDTVLGDMKAQTSDNAKAFADLYINVNPTEEREKEIFYNMTDGLVHCKAQTTLFNHRSKLCKECINRTRCKTLLEDNYTLIFKHRGYDAR